MVKILSGTHIPRKRSAKKRELHGGELQGGATDLQRGTAAYIREKYDLKSSKAGNLARVLLNIIVHEKTRDPLNSEYHITEDFVTEWSRPTIPYTFIKNHYPLVSPENFSNFEELRLMFAREDGVAVITVEELLNEESYRQGGKFYCRQNPQFEKSARDMELEEQERQREQLRVLQAQEQQQQEIQRAAAENERQSLYAKVALKAAAVQQQKNSGAVFYQKTGTLLNPQEITRLEEVAAREASKTIALLRRPDPGQLVQSSVGTFRFYNGRYEKSQAWGYVPATKQDLELLRSMGFE
jgi:hypothetical protein